MAKMESVGPVGPVLHFLRCDSNGHGFAPQPHSTWRMSRAKRPYLPGAFFHLTARTQGTVDWFKTGECKSAIVGYLAEAAHATDTAISAFVAMNNHVHIVARQGHAPISRLMQPFLRRCALLIQRSHGLKGHVFERRYRHRVCRTPEDLRYCICYVHRNPVAAGICDHPGDYVWSSFSAYTSHRSMHVNLQQPPLLVVRDLYALGKDRTPTQLCMDYSRYMESMMRLGRPPGLEPGALPIHGDTFWQELCAPGVALVAHGVNPRRADLRDVVNAGIKELCPELDIAAVRVFRGSWMSLIRARLVERAAQAGYAGSEIARYLSMSDAQVSRILRAYRSIKNAAGGIVE